MNRLSFSPVAAAQVDRIYNRIAVSDPAAAQRVVDRIYAVAEHIRCHPGGGRVTTIRGIRMFVVNPYPYVIYFRYLQNRDEVRIMRVMHTAQRRPGLQEETREFRAC